MHFKNKVKNKTETVKQRAQEDNFKTLSIPSKIIPRERETIVPLDLDSTQSSFHEKREIKRWK